MNIDLILKSFEEKKKITIDNLDLSPIIIDIYLKAGYLTVGHLWKASKKELLKVVEGYPNGDLLFDELVRAVHDLGIFFLYEADDITLDTDIKKLNLSYRSFNILHRNCKTKEVFRACGIDNTLKVRNVLNCEIKQILNFRNSGKVSSEEIVTKIHSLGYLFSGEKGYLEQFSDEVVTENDLKNLDEKIDEVRLDREIANIINRLSKVNGEKYVKGRK